jgi:beta-N-acetylhexosaminidase
LAPAKTRPAPNLLAAEGIPLRRSKVWTRIGGITIAVAIVVALASSAAAGRALFGHRAGAAGRAGRAAAGAAGRATAQRSAAGMASASTAGSGAAGGGARTPAAAAPPSARPVSAGPVSAVPGAAALPSLASIQLAGQRVIYSYSGRTPPAGLFWLIRHGDAAGVIFFGQNISSRAQIRSVISRLDQANASPLNPVREPLLLMTDQEGGAVRRLPGAPLLSEKQVGQSAHPAAAAAAAGTGAGRNLRGAGMNVNLAPVLDVYRTPGDFIDQFGRSYGSHARTVSYLGKDFIKAQQATRVAAASKHFPGLGAATRSQDTDVSPVTLNVSLHSLRTIDEAPYPAAIAAGVRLIMVSWAVYPALDPHRPAGLSRTIVGGELRQRLGFRGVTITDALQAGALRAFGTTANRSVLAAGAGMDLILCSGGRASQGSTARTALQTAYLDGKLNKAAFTAAVQRIIALRSSVRG